MDDTGLTSPRELSALAIVPRKSAAWMKLPCGGVALVGLWGQCTGLAPNLRLDRIPLPVVHAMGS